MTTDDIPKDPQERWVWAVGMVGKYNEKSNEIPPLQREILRLEKHLDTVLHCLYDIRNDPERY
jgi:hypothetical protein